MHTRGLSIGTVVWTDFQSYQLWSSQWKCPEGARPERRCCLVVRALAQDPHSPAASLDVDRTLRLRFLACPRLSDSGKDGAPVTGRVREFFRLVRESALTPASGPREGSTPGSRATAEMPTLGTHSGCVLLPSGSAQSSLEDGEVIQRRRSGGPERLRGARCWAVSLPLRSPPRASEAGPQLSLGALPLCSKRSQSRGGHRCY